MHQYVLLKDYNTWKTLVISVLFLNDSCKHVFNVTIFVLYIDIFKSLLWC